LNNIQFYIFFYVLNNFTLIYDKLDKIVKSGANVVLRIEIKFRILFKKKGKKLYIINLFPNHAIKNQKVKNFIKKKKSCSSNFFFFNFLSKFIY
jgi:hypothetical protein